MGIMIAYHGYDNAVYNAHRNVGAHYTQECIIQGKIWYEPQFLILSIIHILG